MAENPQPGGWNDNRPFVYDMADPLGQKPVNRLLTHYLVTRKGNCITMPVLVRILGERIGLKLQLAEAPLHLLVKFTDDSGDVYNLEPTSGAGFTRDLWYRKKLPMSDLALANGLYLRALPREEEIAVIAAFVVEHLMDSGRYEEALAAADVLLAHYPEFAYLLGKKATVYYRLLKREVLDRYRTASEIPPQTRILADGWYAENQRIFKHLDDLGWQAEDGQ